MSWVTELARPEIRALRPYEHAVWEPGLVRLHANELPWRTVADASEAGLNTYPEPHPHELTAALAAFYGVPASHLIAGRGSDEVIDLLLRAYCRAGQDAILTCPPTFGLYAVAARIQGAAVREVPLARENGFAFDPAALLGHCDAAVKLVFLCSPNNPTGNRLDSGTILDVVRRLEGRALVVVDEAYVEFASQPSLVPQTLAHRGLVVLRTLSKAYGLAGARCGVLIGDPEIVALLRKVIQPYAVTQLTIETVMRALTPAALAQTRERTASILRERARVAAALTRCGNVQRVWPSETNYLLVEFTDPAAALQRAHAAGLLLRDVRGGPGLAQALRISIGSPEQNDRLLASLA